MTKSNFRTWLGWDVGITLLVLTLVACDGIWATDALTALEIKQVQVLDPSDCSVPGEATSAHRVEGVLDVDLPHRAAEENAWPYYLPVVVINNLAAQGKTIAEEMNNITLTHFTVKLSGPSGVFAPENGCPDTFDTRSFSFRLTPGSSTGAALDALTANHAVCLRNAVLPVVVTASIRAKGRHGGTTVESAPLVYPITVCAGCEQQGYAAPDVLTYTYPNYPFCAALASSTTNPYSGNPCLSPGQDAKILCCALPDSTPVCPGVFTGATTPPATK
jgi:hypothetical protein